MDVVDAVARRIEVREFTDEAVDDGTMRAIPDAGRLAPSGRNLAHWRFVQVNTDAGLRALAEASPTGGRVAGAAFAVAFCTDPAYDFDEIDAGRTTACMQLFARGLGVASCIYTVDIEAARDVLGVPDDYDLTAVVGFGYPTSDVESMRGRKDRSPQEEWPSAAGSARRWRFRGEARSPSSREGWGRIPHRARGL